MRHELPSSELTTLIGLVYDAAVDPDAWLAAIEAIRASLDFHNAILALQSSGTGEALMMLAAGVPDGYLPMTPMHGVAVLALWGGPARLAGFALGEPAAQSMVTSPRNWPGNPWYEEFCVPQNLIDCAALLFARDAHLLGHVAWGRHQSKGAIGEHEMSALRALGPHFRRAAAINRLLDMKTIVAETFSRTLDSLSSGILLVDDKLGLVHANTAATAMIEAGDPVRLVRQRVTFGGGLADKLLGSAVDQCARDELGLGQRGLGVPLKSRTGEVTLAHVLPLIAGSTRSALIPRATAAIFITSAQTTPQLPGDALALLYDLTPAEVRVFDGVVAGEHPGAIAGRLGVGLTTVKTHLAHVFQKTGSKRQADLVKLAGSLALNY